MPKKARELSALQVRRLSEPGLHAVGGVSGLHLFVKESGARSWILRVKVGDRRPDIGLGGFPDVTLEQARNNARELREQIRRGVDPIAAKRAALDALKLEQAKALTFEEAAKLCHQAKSSEFRNAKHRKDWLSSLERYAFPVLGSVPVSGIELPHIINVLQPIWATRTETATRTRQRIESVLAWATVSGYRSGDNPARWKGNLEHALPKAAKVRGKVEHHPALPWRQISAFMAELRKKSGMGARALEFAILTAARSSEVRGAMWDEIDLKAQLWTVPADRIKGGKVHRVPLSASAIKLLEALPRFEGSGYVFPAARGGQLSDMTLSKAIKDMHEADLAKGGEGYFDPIQNAVATPHGTARSTFKDWARSCTRFEDEVSELALAHVNDDKTRTAYARDELLPKRERLMREWAKHCDNLPPASNRNIVVPIRR